MARGTTDASPGKDQSQTVPGRLGNCDDGSGFPRHHSRPGLRSQRPHQHRRDRDIRDIGEHFHEALFCGKFDREVRAFCQFAGLRVGPFFDGRENVSGKAG